VTLQIIQTIIAFYANPFNFLELHSREFAN